MLGTLFRRHVATIIQTSDLRIRSKIFRVTGLHAEIVR